MTTSPRITLRLSEDIDTLSIVSSASTATQEAFEEFARQAQQMGMTVHEWRGNRNEEIRSGQVEIKCTERRWARARRRTCSVYAGGRWQNFCKLIDVVPPGGALGWDDKLYLFLNGNREVDEANRDEPEGEDRDESRGESGTAESTAVRVEGGLAVHEYRDLRANPRCLVESHLFHLRRLLSFIPELQRGEIEIHGPHASPQFCEIASTILHLPVSVRAHSPTSSSGTRPAGAGPPDPTTSDMRAQHQTTADMVEDSNLTPHPVPFAPDPGGDRQDSARDSTTEAVCHDLDPTPRLRAVPLPPTTPTTPPGMSTQAGALQSPLKQWPPTSEAIIQLLLAPAADVTRSAEGVTGAGSGTAAGVEAGTSVDAGAGVTASKTPPPLSDSVSPPRTLMSPRSPNLGGPGLTAAATALSSTGPTTPPTKLSRTRSASTTSPTISRAGADSRSWRSNTTSSASSTTATTTESSVPSISSPQDSSSSGTSRGGSTGVNKETRSAVESWEAQLYDGMYTEWTRLRKIVDAGYIWTLPVPPELALVDAHIPLQLGSSVPPGSVPPGTSVTHAPSTPRAAAAPAAGATPPTSVPAVSALPAASVPAPAVRMGSGSGGGGGIGSGVGSGSSNTVREETLKSSSWDTDMERQERLRVKGKRVEQLRAAGN